MITRQIIEDSLGSNDPGRIREILQSYFHEIEDVLPDILGSTLHDDIVPDSARQLAGELYAVTIKALFGDHLYATRLLQEIPTSTSTVSMQQLKRAYRERQVTQLCRDLCYFSSGNEYLRELVSRTLPNVRKLYDLSSAITGGRKNRWDQTDCGINKLTGLVVSFSILYRALHDKPELTDVEVEALQYAETKISLQLGNRSPNDPCEIALNRLKGDILSLVADSDVSVSEYSNHSIRSVDADSESEAEEGEAMTSARRRSAPSSPFVPYPAFIHAYLQALTVCPCFTDSFVVLFAIPAFMFLKFHISTLAVVPELARLLFLIAGLPVIAIMYYASYYVDRHSSYFSSVSRSIFTFFINRSLYPVNPVHADWNQNWNQKLNFKNMLISVIASPIILPLSILSSTVTDLVCILMIVILQSIALAGIVFYCMDFIFQTLTDNLDTRITDIHKVFRTLSPQMTLYLQRMQQLIDFISFTVQANCHLVINCMIRPLEAAIVRPILYAFGLIAPDDESLSRFIQAVESHMFVDDIWKLPNILTGNPRSLSDEYDGLSSDHTHWRPLGR